MAALLSQIGTKNKCLMEHTFSREEHKGFDLNDLVQILKRIEILIRMKRAIGKQ